jgi:magnesium transporter
VLTAVVVGPSDAPRSHHVTDIDPRDISELRSRAHQLIWVDVVDPTADDLAVIADEFDLHPLAVEDASKHGQRAKVERFGAHSFVVVYTGRRQEVDLFIGEGWVVTIRGAGTDGTLWDLAQARGRFLRSCDAEPDVGICVYVILDEIVDSWFDYLDDAEDHLESIEDRIFNDERPSDERDVQQQLFVVRRELLLARRALVPMRDVLAAVLRRDVPAVRGDALVLMQDVFDHVLRAIDQLDVQHELMGNAVDAHLAIISNRLSEVNKAVASWGAILFGASLIAGIYGMNFEHMPELSWTVGYPLALAMMVLLTLTLRWAFKRRGWL